jgi:hypothetical protein
MCSPDGERLVVSLEVGLVEIPRSGAPRSVPLQPDAADPPLFRQAFSWVFPGRQNRRGRPPGDHVGGP